MVGYSNLLFGAMLIRTPLNDFNNLCGMLSLSKYTCTHFHLPKWISVMGASCFVLCGGVRISDEDI